MADTHPDPASLLGNTIVGNYRLEPYYTDSGGFSYVYKALHTDPQNPLVAAVKVIKGNIVENSWNEVLAEISKQDQIDSSYVVKIKDTYRIDGFGYIVMEWVEGKNLDQAIRDKFLYTEYDLLRTSIYICRGISHIHRAKLTHYDITPRNILIKSGDKKPKIIDFGLSRKVDEERFSGKGTIKYLAPELLSTDTSRKLADDKADIYSLGAVLFFMFSGGMYYLQEVDDEQVPSSREARRKRNQYVANAIRNSIPRKLENPIISKDNLTYLNDMLSVMLDKDPSQRPEIKEIEEYLEEILSHSSKSTMEATHSISYSLHGPATPVATISKKRTIKPSNLIFLVDGTMYDMNYDWVERFLEETFELLLKEDHSQMKFACVFYGEHSAVPADKVSIPFEYLYQPFGTPDELDTFLKNIDKQVPHTAFLHQDLCNALELGLKQVGELTSSIYDENVKNYLLLLGMSPPHPTPREREHFELLDWTCDEFEGNFEWKNYLGQLKRYKVERYCFWLHPPKPQPRRVRYYPPNLIRYCEYVWKEISSSDSFIEIRDENSLNLCIKDWKLILNSKVLQFIN